MGLPYNGRVCTFIAVHICCVYCGALVTFVFSYCIAWLCVVTMASYVVSCIYCILSRILLYMCVVTFNHGLVYSLMSASVVYVGSNKVILFTC